MRRLRARFLPRDRLTTPREFGKVFANAERSADRFFTVLACASDAARPRLGLSVSKRVARRAVDRNRLKRLSRESFRRALEDLPAWDFVVMAKRRAVEADNAMLRASLNQHWDRLRERARRSGHG